MEYIFFLFLFHFVPIRDKEERSRSKSAIARPVRTCNRPWASMSKYSRGEAGFFMLLTYLLAYM